MSECAVYDGGNSVSAQLETRQYFFLCQSYSELLAVMWAVLAFPPIQEAVWLKAVFDCVVQSIPALVHYLALRTSICFYLSVFELHRVMNRRATHSRPTSGSLWFFSPPRQTAAGKMLQPPHQWHHLQKDLEAFTPIPPTDPPPTRFLLIPTFLDPPQLSLPKLIPWPPFFGTGWETARHSRGLEMTFSPLRIKLFTFPIWTTAAPLEACVGDSYSHHTVCTVSTWCPCCLFVFLFTVYIHTVGSQQRIGPHLVNWDAFTLPLFEIIT